MMGDGDDMGEGLTIDVGNALPYVLDGLLGLVGKDTASIEWKTKVTELVKLSTKHASMVQCVGMPEPIPINDIYQKSTLYVPPQGNTLGLETLIANSQEAVIYGGPGWGKTTLVHWMYMRLLTDTNYIPLLFTLRWPGTVETLQAVVQQI